MGSYEKLQGVKVVSVVPGTDWFAKLFRVNDGDDGKSGDVIACPVIAFRFYENGAHDMLIMGLDRFPQVIGPEDYVRKVYSVEYLPGRVVMTDVCSGLNECPAHPGMFGDH